MNIPADALSPTGGLIAFAVAGMLLAVALATAPWRKFLQSDSMNVYFGALTFALVLWNLRAGVVPGVEFHFFGLTALCLMFDWQFALLAGSLLAAVATYNAGGHWSAFGGNILLLAVLPTLWVRLLLFLAQKYVIRHFFVYIYFNTFFAAASSILLMGLVASFLIAGEGGYGDFHLGDEYWISLWLLAFPEGLMNGLIMTVLVVYRPHWVATFHDRWYLKGK